mgnify:CR=1 FL=1
MSIKKIEKNTKIDKTEDKKKELKSTKKKSYHK